MITSSRVLPIVPGALYADDRGNGALVWAWSANHEGLCWVAYWDGTGPPTFMVMVDRAGGLPIQDGWRRIL